MNKKRHYKKRSLWSSRAEKLLLDIWSKREPDLRITKSCRKQAIFEEMSTELRRQKCAVSVQEVKTKIHNLKNRYWREFHLAEPSKWPLFSKMFAIVGHYKYFRATDPTPSQIVKKEQKLSHEKVEQLIDLVKSTPGLYDMTNIWYTKSNWRDEAWKEIAGTLKRNEILCQNAWRCLRNQFEKNVQDINDGLVEPDVENDRRFKYFEQLSFLKGYINTKENISDNLYKTYETKLEVRDDDIGIIPCATTAKEDPLMSDDFDYSDCSPTLSLHSEGLTTNTKKTKIPKLTNNCSDTSASSSSSFHFKNSRQATKKKNDLEKADTPLPELVIELVNRLSERKPPEYDGVDNFFLSLASTVKRYNLSVSDLTLFQCKTMIFATEELEKLSNKK